jgi:hypothetical protein
MPRPGFYNDNEYRAYPFVYQVRAQTELTFPEKLIVDAGFIMGLDADFDPTAHTIWLHTITRSANAVQIVFKTDAPGAADTPLTFYRDLAAAEWLSEHAQTEPAAKPCAAEPIWEGFLVTSALTRIENELPVGGTTYAKNEYQLEPARIQNLAKSYLRSISLGNYARTAIPECGAAASTPQRPVIVNALCLKGNIKFKEGYQSEITQDARLNTINLSAGTNSGAEKDENFCAAGSELPLFPGEQIDPDKKFYGGGPACDELIFTINGLGGKNITLVGGNGVAITTTEDNKIKLSPATNAANACPPPTEPPL